MPGPDRVSDWVALVDRCYPEAEAAGWDATGLQVGDPDQPVGAVLVCLDVTGAVIAEAAERGADLILAHHPLLFRGLERLTPTTAAGRLALAAAGAGLAVLAAHTNFDVALDGTSAPVVDLLGLIDVEPLVDQPGPDAVKLVAFVPVAHTAAVLAALSEAGAGVVGEYDQCSFRLTGTGTFRPSAAANPVVGDRQVRNEVAEDRLEMVLPRPRLRSAVDALRAAHPYEEVAFDIYPLVPSPSPSPGKGLGRVGNLPEPLPLAGVAARLAGGLPSPFLRAAGEPSAAVRRVAVCGGAGDSLIDAARRAGADCFVTGDLRHHPVLDALTMGLTLIDAGHYDTEAPALPALVATLKGTAAAHGLSARLLLSSVPTRPWVDWRNGVDAAGRGRA